MIDDDGPPANYDSIKPGCVAYASTIMRINHQGLWFNGSLMALKQVLYN